jgi:hypothetical protein
VQVSLLITAVEGEDDAFVVTTLTANTSAIEIISVESILFDDGIGRLVIDGDLPPFDQFNPGGTPAA